MATDRSEISRKNKYWISKHNYLRLKHMCMMYREYKQQYEALINTARGIEYTGMPGGGGSGAPTERAAMKAADVSAKINAIEAAAAECDTELGKYILYYVTTEGTTFKTMLKMGVPVSQNTFYERRRRFFWLLSKKII